MNTARVVVDLGDARQAQAVLAALQPETSDGPEGTATRLALEGTAIMAELEAPDVSGLRAALNSLIRLLDAAWKATEAGGPQSLNR